MATWADVRRIASTLPETSEDSSRGLLSWNVKGRGIAWERPLRRADLEALGDDAPDGPVLAAHVPDLGAKGIAGRGSRRLLHHPAFRRLPRNPRPTRHHRRGRARGARRRGVAGSIRRSDSSGPTSTPGDEPPSVRHARRPLPATVGTAETGPYAGIVTLRLYDTGAPGDARLRPAGAGTGHDLPMRGHRAVAAAHRAHLSGLDFDILRRWLEHEGYQVTFCRNVTDIDDKVLAERCCGDSVVCLGGGQSAGFHPGLRRAGVPATDRRAAQPVTCRR